MSDEYEYEPVILRNVGTPLPLDKFKWIKCSHGFLPKNAIEAGADGDHKLYVARALCAKHLIPGYFHEKDKRCHVAWGDKGMEFDNYEVLVGDPTEIHWKISMNGFLATRAIEGGVTVDGEKQYIGRVHFNKVIALGNILPGEGFCYVPYAKTKRSFQEYEVLHC